MKGMVGKKWNYRKEMKGLGKNSGGGGGGGLRGAVYCDDDNRFIVTCICMPSQGDLNKIISLNVYNSYRYGIHKKTKYSMKISSVKLVLEENFV
jgi:hypothetical protein